jgi:membrane protein implicated in regulation of membrane protease activity
MRWLVALLVLAAALALVGTLAHSALAGWAGVGALVAAFVAYVAWRRAVRQRRLT